MEEEVQQSKTLHSCDSVKIKQNETEKLSKIENIMRACDGKDYETLVQLADTELGFVNDDARKLAWPILIGERTKSATDGDRSWTELDAHRDEDQVQLDVDRAFVYYPSEDSKKQQDQRKDELKALIIHVLRFHPRLCYFQGYHDIVQVFLLVLGDEPRTARILERLSLLRLRDFMHDTITPAIAHLSLLPAVLRTADLELAKHLANTQPFFALAPTLTLYAHVIQEYGDIARLFDFLLSHEAAMSVYLFAVIVCARKKELMEIDPEESDILHSILSKLPQPLDLERLISQTIILYSRYPPAKLPRKVWSQVSAYSVLRTTNDARSLAMQSVEDGEKYFSHHAKQMKLKQGVNAIGKNLWRIRKPTAYIGLAVLVGLLSWWLRGNTIATYLPAYFHRFRKALS